MNAIQTESVRMPPLTTVAPIGQKRIVLVDDHPIVRKGLRALLEQEPDLMVCAEAGTQQEAMQVVMEHRPDLVSDDIALGGASGLDLVKDLKSRMESLSIVAISMFDEQLYAERALRAGASGYVMKEETPEFLLMAVRQVLQGGIYVSVAMASMLMKRAVNLEAAPSASPLSHLSDRELEIFRMIGQGLSTRDIASNLHLSTKTVESHREGLKRKLNLRNANDLVRYAVEWQKC